VIAALLRARKAEVLAQDIEQREPVVGLRGCVRPLICSENELEVAFLVMSGRVCITTAGGSTPVARNFVSKRSNMGRSRRTFVQ
jgi:hypothetical protein